MYMQLCDKTKNLNFYKDEYMMELLDMSVPSEDLEITDLGISLEFAGIQRKFWKLVHTDIDQKFRNVLLVGVESAQLEKWQLGLHKQLLDSVEQMDKGLY
jgi:hypothetical protein